CNLIALRIPARSKYAEPVSTTYKISTSTSRWIRWWPSQACPGRENPHWRWVCFTPKDHAATSKHYPPTPGAVWGKLLAPMLTKSVTSRQLYRYVRDPAYRVCARHLGPPPNCLTSYGSCFRAWVVTFVPMGTGSSPPWRWPLKRRSLVRSVVCTFMPPAPKTWHSIRLAPVPPARGPVPCVRSMTTL